MAAITEDRVLEALKGVTDPDKGADIVSLGMVSGVVVKDGNVGLTIEVDPARGAALEPVRKAAEAAVRALDGVLSVTAVLTAHRDQAAGGPGGGPGGGGPVGGQGGGPGGGRGPRQQPGQGDMLLPDVGAIIAVASGKGGVGKSTTAANLAIALAAAGHRTGLLDADVYGPSLPIMMGLNEPPESPDGSKLLPLQAHGVACMSIGLLVDPDTPMIWRGPMVMSALEQLMRDVEWGALDVMVVDMPPGTGDAQLTMAQRVPLAGAVIVSTPQDLSLADARKGLNMFRKVEVPVLGIIENMSYFLCPKCGERTEIFAHGGAKAAAADMHVDFLGDIPLDPVIRETTDSGTPVMASQPDGPYAAIYRDIAAKIWEKIGGATKAAPKIIVQ